MPLSPAPLGSCSTGGSPDLLQPSKCGALQASSTLLRPQSLSHYTSSHGVHQSPHSIPWITHEDLTCTVSISISLCDTFSVGEKKTFQLSQNHLDLNEFSTKGFSWDESDERLYIENEIPFQDGIFFPGSRRSCEANIVIAGAEGLGALCCTCSSNHSLTKFIMFV